MQRDHLSKLNQWLQEHLESFKDRGADEESLDDPIIRTLIDELSLQRHRHDFGLGNLVFLELFKLASPDELRKMAAASLALGDLEAADELDLLAGVREGWRAS